MAYTTKENYARNELIKVGAHFILDKVKQMMNYAYWAKDAVATWTAKHTFNSTVEFKDNVTVADGKTVDGVDISAIANAIIGAASGKKIVFGYDEELTDATTKTVATGLSSVDVVVAVEGTEAATTPASKILANKSATAGSIELTAKGASGTTKVHWIAIGDK